MCTAPFEPVTSARDCRLAAEEQGKTFRGKVPLYGMEIFSFAQRGCLLSKDTKYTGVWWSPNGMMKQENVTYKKMSSICYITVRQTFSKGNEPDLASYFTVVYVGIHMQQRLHEEMYKKENKDMNHKITKIAYSSKVQFIALFIKEIAQLNPHLIKTIILNLT